MSTRLIAGAMSGTSADGIDVAIVKISGRGDDMAAQLLSRSHTPYDAGIRRRIFGVRGGETVSLAELTRLGGDISHAYADAVNAALRDARLTAADISGVAAHGQTLFHDPPFTLQWFDPAVVAAETGCTVVSDFRRADCAAGGQGAPLVSFADFLLFRHPVRNRILLNIGGIANLTYLPAGGGIDDLRAFDTGPGNCLSDHLCRCREPDGPGIDESGRRAAGAAPVKAIVDAFLTEPWFGMAPPRSTDGPAMIAMFQRAARAAGGSYELETLLATAAECTAGAVVAAVRRFLPVSSAELIVSGGGTQNRAIMDSLLHCGCFASVQTTDQWGMPSDAKEAVAFALLGAATLDNLPSNAPAATGAKRRVVLGSITPPPTPRPTPRPTAAAQGAAPAQSVSGGRPTQVIDRAGLLTEQRLAASMNLDRMETAEAVAMMSRQDALAVEAVASQSEAIAHAVDLVAAGLGGGGRLIYVGAGTSGRLGVLDASECPPTFRSDPAQVQGIIAGGNDAMFRAREGAEDRAEDGAAAMDDKAVAAGDVIVGIAAGGTTPFVQGALRRASARGAGTVFITCVGPVPGEPRVDRVIRPLTGPEVVTGSTRLKAGTATKLVLNMLSTLSMVRMGKVYENLMVDLRATNEKLRDRAARIISTITGIEDRQACLSLLDRAGGHVTLAVVMHERGVDASQAQDALDRAGGRLREAIGR